MKRTYLITGATGFIGANLVRQLLVQNKAVHIITRPDSNFWRLKGVLSKLTVHKIQPEDTQILTKTIKNIAPDYIFHLAAYGSYPAQTDITQMLRINIDFSTSLLTAINTIPYTSCILTGSSSEYGFKTKPMSENNLLEPASFYAATKAAITHIALVFARQYNKPITVVRPFSVYGPYEECTRFVPTAITKCLKNEDMPLTNGQEKRDFLYVEDFIDCFLQIADKSDVTAGKIINIASGKQTSTRKIMNAIHLLTKSKSTLLWGRYPNRSWDTTYWKADTHLVKKIVGWKPAYSLSEGLQKTIDWFIHNRDIYEK
jgi:nucleoside-diphosphate-sugar epimerase